MIRAIRLRNWGPYRGDHELLLGEKAYGVFARDERDDERSNWAGKSMLLEAVDFALFGRVNPDRHFGKNDWISEGESEGSVQVVLDGACFGGSDVSGFEVRRSRKRSSSEKFVARHIGQGEGGATQDAGELEVVRRIGLSKEDFLTAAYFRQRAMAQLVLMDPGPRMKVVSRWAELDPLEKAEADRRSKFREATKETAEIAAKVAQLEAAAAEAVAQFGVLSVEELVFEWQKLEEGIEHDASELKATIVECEAAQKDHALRARSAEFLVLRKEGVELRQQFDVVDRPALQAEHDAHRARAKELLLEIGPLRKEVEQKRLLARGHFSGSCPVASAPCPSREWVVGEGKKAEAFASAVEKKLEALSREYGLAEHATKQVEIRLQDHDRVRVRLDVMRARAQHLKESHDRAQEKGALDAAQVEALFADMRKRQEEVAQMRAAQRQMGAAIDLARPKLAEADKLREKARDLAARARAHHEAAGVFAAAKRRIGEHSLAEIEAGANEVLSDCGVDLRVAASWSREGGDPAKNCPDCGSAMPASAKVKTCALCGAERGLNVINELRLRLSSHSGAAEDLTGMALQLSAGDWLRARRGSAWSTGLLDEPFSACDRRHQKLMAAHLAHVLAGRRGFRQAIICAHNPQILEALPGRIEIVRRGRWSEVKVA